MAQLKKLANQTAIYGLSSIVGRFLNYLLVPLYTYKIAAESGGYGVVTNIYAYTAFLLVLLTFGMETTFFRFANRDGIDPKKAFSTALLSVGLVALTFMALCTAFLHPIASFLNYADHPEYIEIMAIVTALDAFQAILYAKLRNDNRPVKFATLKLSFIFLNIGLNLFIFLLAPTLYQNYPTLMSWYNPNYQVGYIFVVNLICTSLITLGFIPELKDARHGIDMPLLKKMMKYTGPLLILGLVGILNQVADKICYRFIVPGAEGEVQLGIYGACVKIAMIMAVITQAFRYAYEPFVFGENHRNAQQNTITQAKVMKYFVMFTLLAFLAVMMYLDILRYIIQEKYWDGLRAVPIVMMAEVFMGIYFNLSFWYKLCDKTYWGAIMSAIGCIVMLAINFIFVPKFGYMACAWGGFFGYGICMLLSYFIGQKESYVPYSILTIFKYFGITLCLYFLSSLLTNACFFGWQLQIWANTPTLIVRIVINTILFLCYCAFILYNEKSLVNSLFSSIQRKIFKK